MIEAASLALSEIWTRPFRAVLWKSLALTLALLAVFWTAGHYLLHHYISFSRGWIETLFSILSGLGLLIGLAFLVAPVTALFAGLFLDDIAEVVERTHYAGDPPGRAMPAVRSIVATLRFTLVVLLVNAVALPLVLVLGFGAVIFFVANAYLLGREYFELAALRFHDPRTVRAMRERHGIQLFMAGGMIALVVAIPIVNLIAPLFATAFMVHVFKEIEAADRSSGRLLATPAAT
ncbi:sulfate transporter family protein [Faunimonas pinastri]|uniref:sulfate transporter family protein n=1 Tax=Faunimonas pinastri TaxID=1855383 RepID=UPI000B832BB4|nr:sulfate transporter family protein [Faunimonas pinastri]